MITGEYRKAAVDMVYDANPSVLIVGKSIAVPVTERLFQFFKGCNQKAMNERPLSDGEAEHTCG